MTVSLSKWIGDSDALRHLEYFRATQSLVGLAHIRARADEYYLSLVGDLFDRMREGNENSAEWARLGNALAAGIRASTTISPKCMVCGKGDARKLRVAQRGASIACWIFMPK